MKLDLAFTLEPDDDVPSMMIMEALDWILNIESEYPGCLGDTLKVLKRVKAGGFDCQDFMALHRLNEPLHKSILEYCEKLVEDFDMFRHLASIYTAAEAIKDTFHGKNGKCHYWPTEEAVRLFALLTKRKEAAGDQGTMLGGK